MPRATNCVGSLLTIGSRWLCWDNTRAVLLAEIAPPPQLARPSHVAKGLLHLAREYSADAVDLACQRALQYGSLSFASIRQICQQGLYRFETSVLVPPIGLGGYHHELSLYDQLTRMELLKAI